MSDKKPLRDLNGNILHYADGKPIPMEVYENDYPDPDLPEEELKRVLAMLDEEGADDEGK